MDVGRVDHDVGSAMVKCLHHPCLHRAATTLRTGYSGSWGRISKRLRSPPVPHVCGNRSESLVMWNMVVYFRGHALVESPEERSTRTGRALVDCCREFGIASGSEDRRGASIRVDASELAGGQRKAPVHVIEFGYILKEETAIGWRVVWRRGGDEGAELETAVDVPGRKAVHRSACAGSRSRRALSGALPLPRP